jgi:hypothetical protein
MMMIMVKMLFVQDGRDVSPRPCLEGAGQSSHYLHTPSCNYSPESTLNSIPPASFKGPWRTSPHAKASILLYDNS